MGQHDYTDEALALLNSTFSETQNLNGQKKKNAIKGPQP